MIIRRYYLLFRSIIFNLDYSFKEGDFYNGIEEIWY